MGLLRNLLSDGKQLVGVVRFPGTNCDFDIFKMVEEKKHTPQWLWHKDHFDVAAIDMVIVPGGFSYGDYLRCGALAARSPVMESLRDFVKLGKPVLGICNGFQILCESGLLEGALVQNEQRRFIDDWAELSLENQNPFFAKKAKIKIRLPIAHGEGRFYASEDKLKYLEDKDLIWWRYQKNPNGALHDIDGVMNLQKNVAALMPHPERALFQWMGGTDGWDFL